MRRSDWVRHAGKNWGVMTAWDYYITARHEIDPSYTNKSQRRLYLKCFSIAWYNCYEEKTNEVCVYGTVGLVGDGNLRQQPGNGELWPTGITCAPSSQTVSGLSPTFLLFSPSFLVTELHLTKQNLQIRDNSREFQNHFLKWLSKSTRIQNINLWTSAPLKFSIPPVTYYFYKWIGSLWRHL